MSILNRKHLTTFLIAIQLSGCGTITPNIQEFWGDYNDAAQIERNLVGQVSCELRQAVWYIVASNRYQHSVNPTKVPLRYEYLKDWVAQIQLYISIEDKSSANASFDYSEILPNAVARLSGGRVGTASQSFSLGTGIGVANTATRIDKMFLNYRVKDFIDAKITNRTCLPQLANGTLFIQSNLRIYEWLKGMLDVQVSQGIESAVEAQAQFSEQADAISHDIKFEIVTSGGVTPIWQLVPFGASGAPALNASRDRIQQLVITLSPPDKANPNQLGPTGYASSLASQINISLSNAFRRMP